MGNTRGIHWIATTHGTWLHGDVRHSWRDGKLIGPDPFLEAAIRARMTHDAVVLSVAEMAAVSGILGATVKEQGHRVLAATVQSTHVHAVFAPLQEDVKTTIARMKKRSADVVLHVRRKRGDARQHLWTQGQYPVFIFDDDHLHNAIAYVRRHNTLVGRPADPYDWITPLGVRHRGQIPGQDGGAIWGASRLRRPGYIAGPSWPGGGGAANQTLCLTAVPVESGITS